MKLLFVAASLRKDSINRKLVREGARVFESQGGTPVFSEYSEFEAPLYNGDLDDGKTFAEGVEKFAKLLDETDGVVLASPEYNYSIPGHLKNLIDWVSRMRPMPLKDKKFFLISSSPGGAGGGRGLWQVRIPLEGLGAHVYPQMYTLPGSMQEFNENDQLVDEKMFDRLGQNIKSFSDYVERLSD